MEIPKLIKLLQSLPEGSNVVIPSSAHNYREPSITQHTVVVEHRYPKDVECGDRVTVL